MKPLVSVVMATYNDDIEYLGQAIKSILDQTYQNIEFIIVDDSSNESANYLQRIAKEDSRIKYIHNNPQIGFVRSLNKGIAQANGQFIARMDSDDMSNIFRIEKQVKFFNDHPEVGIVGTSIEFINEKGDVISHRNFKTDFNEIINDIFFRGAVAHPTVMLRKAVIDQIGLYDETFEMAEDYELWLRAIRKGVIINNIPDKLLKYRMPVDYHTKRSSCNWKYNLKAKVKNFNVRYLLRNSLGIITCLFFLVLPNWLRAILFKLRIHFRLN